MNHDFFMSTQAVGEHALKKKSCVSINEVGNAFTFHQGLPGYMPTPLVSLSALANKIGVEQIWLKDESKRFGLNAFKALGGSYAIAKYFCEKMNLELGENIFAELTSEKYRKEVQKFTFVTATDGNHGRGVAWVAKLLGCPAWVYLPHGTREERLQNILGLGAQAEITPWNYDDTVRYANDMAQQNGWVLVQDTALPGYEEIPKNITKGYVTLACEIDQALREGNCPKPTHLFLQAGVGSMAAAIAGYLAFLWQEECPKIIVVEPTQADCLYRTAKAKDGKIHAVTGDMNSMMAGLCCGEPSPLAWDILKDLASAFISCDDFYSAEGMRILAYPQKGDTAIVSGESGAVTTGVIAHLMQDEELSGYRRELGLDEKSRILLISTEGDTDRDNYNKVLGEKPSQVW